MPVQTLNTRVKAPAISHPHNIPAEARSANEKATLNLLGRVGFDRPLKVVLLMIKMFIIKY